jgi:PadR family transcriptional regulator PadR
VIKQQSFAQRVNRLAYDHQIRDANGKLFRSQSHQFRSLAMMHQLKSKHFRRRHCFPLTFDKTESQTIVGYRGEGMPTSTDLLQGTLDLLILRTLALGPMHGWGVAQRIQQVSKDVLQVGQGSLYPALYRLEYKGWIKSDWGSSENNRRAKFYRLTAAGRKQLETELATWDRLSDAIALVLGRGAEASS